MNHPPQPVSALLTVAATAGLTVQIVNGQLFVKGPKRAAALGQAVLARKAEVFAHLTAVVAWDAAAAIARMHAADAVVEACGCVGADPHIQGRAWRAFDAYRTRDMESLLRACDEIEALARAKANPSGTART